MSDRDQDEVALPPAVVSDAGARSRDRTGRPFPSGPGRTLVGRERELEALRSFLDETAMRGGTLVVSGEPGVGKTALLEAAAVHAHDLELQVVPAAGAEFEVDVSFATLNQLLGRQCCVER